MPRSVTTFMPLYVSDWLADTTDLTLEEQGAYFLLTMNLWKKGGELSADHARLALRLGISRRKFSSIWRVISVYFKVRNGVLTHPRVTEELSKARALTARRSALARAS